MFEMPIIEFDPIDVGGVMDAPPVPEAWRDAFAHLLPGMKGFSPHHSEAGDWLQSITLGASARPFGSFWPRGHGKSTIAELGGSYWGATRRRRFVLYVCDTQDAADRHVQSVGTLLERLGGDIGSRMETSYGHSKGWTRNMLRTRSGFTVLGLGLDVAMRGIKMDDMRPDAIVFDDVDGRHDTTATTKRKVETITQTILPAGADGLVVWFVQNLIIPNGIASQLARGEADFLAGMIVSGPVPAVRDMTTEQRHVDTWTFSDGATMEVNKHVHVITSGSASWEGCNLDTCQREIFQFGFKAFAREKQHQVGDVEGALLKSEQISRIGAEALDKITLAVVAVDPATTSKESSDETGIIGCGKDAAGHGYVTHDATGRYTPAQWGRRAVLLADRIGARRIVAESNQGGDMVKAVIDNAAKELFAEGARDSPTISVRLVHASKSKRARAEPIAQRYEEHTIHHVVHTGRDADLSGLEGEWTTWDASNGSESPNRIDGATWGLTDLLIKKAPFLGGV